MASYIPVTLQQQVREDAGRRCGYCLGSEMVTGIPLEIEHLIPESAGGPTARENLWLACHRCKMNNDYVVEARRFWVFAGWHPPLE